MAETELNAEMLRQTRSKAKGPSATALKDQIHSLSPRHTSTAHFLPFSCGSVSLR